MLKYKLLNSYNNIQIVRLSLNSPKCDKTMRSAEHPAL